MLFKKIRQNKSGVSNIISTLLITSIMITSIAITYVYIIPTIDRGRMNATISTSSLFLNKMDGAIQSLLFDGQGAARTIEVDAFAGNLEFRREALNVRAYIDGSMYIPIPALEYGLARLDIPGDIKIISNNAIEYIRGSPYDSPAITYDGDGTIDPAVITLERPDTELYRMQLSYRLMIQIRDTGVGGTIDVTIIAIDFTDAESIRGLNSGNYLLTINKTAVDLNPSRYGFAGDGSPIETSGDDFYLAINSGAGLEPIFTSAGARTNVRFNLIVMTFDFHTTQLI